MRQIILYVTLLLFIALSGKAQERPSLGDAESYTVLAGTGVTNSGNTKIDGNLGVAPGTGFSGFPPGLVNGRRDINNAAAASAQNVLAQVYNQAQSISPATNLSGQNLGNRTLTPGIYKFDADALLTGSLVLNNGGNPDAVFIFQVGGNLTISNGATINFSNAAAPRVINIFWQVAGSAAIGDNSIIKGSFLVNQNITMNSGASVQGRLLAKNGTVSLTNNIITIPTDLELTQTVSAGIRKADIYSIGDNVTFTLTAKNLGPINNTNVRIDHRLGAGLEFVSASLGGWTYNATTGIRTWSLPNFATGTTQTISIVARITNSSPVYKESRATIEGDKIDEIPNNTTTAEICVMPADPGIITGPAAVCQDQTNYNFSVTPITGATAYNWTLPRGWAITSGENTASIRVTAGSEAGNITVTVTNNCGETLPSSKSLTVSTTPSPAPGPITPGNGTNNPCVADKTITYTVDPVPGALSYRWEKPSDWIITQGEGTRSITVTVGTASGNIKVFAVNGCGESAPSILAVVPSVAIPNTPPVINGSSKPCINESNNYSVNPVAGATSYRWIVPAGLEILTGQGTANITLKPTSNANATIRVEAINGCGTTTASLDISPINQVKPAAISGPARPCINTSTTYSIAPVPGATSYFWTVPGLTNVPGQGTTSITFSPAGSTTITVSALFECGFSPQETFRITPITRPVQPAPIVSTKNQICAGNEVTFSIPAITGATRYEWSASGDWVINSGQNTTTITVRAGSTESTIKVIALNDCGPSDPRTLLMQPLLNAPNQPVAIAGPVSPCVGQASATYSIAAVTNAAGYTWAVPNTWEILSGQGTTSIQVKVGTEGGNISVAASNDCGSTARTLAVTPSTAVPPAVGPINASVMQPCINNAELVTYSVVPIAGITVYNWVVQENNGWQLVSGQGTPTITVKVGTNAHTISVNAANDCGAGAPRSIDVTPSTAAPGSPGRIAGNLVPCTSQTELIYSIENVAQATRYIWSVNGANWQITSGQGTTSIRVKAGTSAGTISVKAANNCGESSEQVLTVTPGTAMPPKPGPITGNTNLCVGQTNQTYTVPAGTSIESYEWTLPEGWNMVSGGSSNSIVVNVGSGAGTISVRAINGCGRSEASELAVAPTTAAPANPGIIQASKTLFCAGETSLAYSVPQVPRASTYNWTVPDGWTITSGLGTNTIVVTAGSTAGNISLVVYNNCGAASASLAVAPNVKPATPSPIVGMAVPCARSAGNIYSIAAVPGATRYEWEVPAGWRISAGATTTAITVETGTEAGNITVTAFNDCGSTSTKLAVAPATGVPESIGSITGNKSVCANNTDNLTYTVAAVASATEYIWTVPEGWTIASGQGSATITVKSSNKTGIISVLTKNGCGIGASSSLPVEVTGQAPLSAGNISGTTAMCANKEVTYSIGSVSGATSYAWEVPTDWVITAGQGTTAIKVTTGKTAGNVSVKTMNGCGSSLEATVLPVVITSVPESPVAITGDKDQCAGNTGKVYSIAEVAGTTSYKWQVPSDWVITAGQGTTAITITAGSASGNVTVVAVNTCGDSQTQIMAVNSASTPSPAPAKIKASNDLICSEQAGLTYTIDPVPTATSYNWTLPEGWNITAGQGTTSITVTAGTAAGNIAVNAQNGCGVSGESKLAVDPTKTAAIAIGTITGETITCSGLKGLVYTVPVVPGATTYKWEVPADWKITAGEGTNSITVTAGLASGLIAVEAANTCATSLKSTLEVKTNPSPAALAPIKDLSNSCQGLAYAVPAAVGVTEYTWTVPEGWMITAGQGTTEIKVTAPAGSAKGLISVVAQTATCNTVPVTLEANPARADVDLTIANVFSPNGDGVNDKWEILNIQNYTENDLVIINRWGSEVYRSKKYQNQWDGGELSAGTYFYVLKVKVCDGTFKTHKGYVMIMK